MGVIEKFTKGFGESIEEFDEDIILAVSAPQIEAIVDLDKFQKRFNVIFRTYSFELPKPDANKYESVKYNNQWFDLKRIRTMIKIFVEGVIEAGTFVEQEILLVIKITEVYGFVLAPRRVDREKYIPGYWELEYDWNDIFHEQTFGSDMVL